MARSKGVCAVCGRTITIKIGVGPYAQGRGDLMWHKAPKSKDWCLGSDAKPRPEAK